MVRAGGAVWRGRFAAVAFSGLSGAVMPLPLTVVVVAVVGVAIAVVTARDGEVGAVAGAFCRDMARSANGVLPDSAIQMLRGVCVPRRPGASSTSLGVKPTVFC